MLHAIYVFIALFLIKFLRSIFSSIQSKIGFSINTGLFKYIILIIYVGGRWSHSTVYTKNTKKNFFVLKKISPLEKAFLTKKKIKT